MPEILNIDDLVFAKVRAKYLEPPGRAADRLIEAAADPHRLDGVTRARTLIFAADVLIRAGELQAAISLLQRMLDDGTPDRYGDGGQMLARALIRAGRPEEAEVLIRARSAVLPNQAVAFWIAIPDLAEAGYYEQALRFTDAIEDIHPSGYYTADLRKARGKIQAMAATGGLAAAGQATGPTPGSTRYALWWPLAEYARLCRQVPEVTSAIGSPWRQHIAGVEADLRDRTRLGERDLRLVPADFDEFVAFLVAADVDPRTEAAMDRFAQPGSQTLDWFAPTWARTPADTAAWPPQPKDRCWCSSGRRYKNCCGALTR